MITLETGAYEIHVLEEAIRVQLSIQEKTPLEEIRKKFLLKPDVSTSKCHLFSDYIIDFTPDDSIGSMLGFSQQVLPANTLHKSDLPVNIIKVQTIRVQCNITSGAFEGSTPAHTLYQFAPLESPGESIDIKPRIHIYLPVNKSVIENITIKLVDQTGELVNFRGEDIYV